MSNILYQTLKKYFGYDTFRQYQEEIITSMLEGNDTVAIMPTGAGKSLCYQLPAIISEGTTIVISPLISLMKDQVDYLDNIGIPAVYLNSSLSSAEFRERLRGIYNNRYKIIYAAPERLETEGFIQSINSLSLPCTQLIIDEAHCVSRWGHDFRPSYTKIIEFIKQLGNRPTISAFTATATDAVRDDIENALGLRTPNRFITGFDRENLEFKVLVNVEKDRYLREFIKENIYDTGIIYAATRKEADRLYGMLQKSGINSAVYHAGLSDQQRNQAQEDFIYDNVSVMVATNAFGMGIDKSNVRYVIHYNMPGDLESYYQEAGRAGRDGLPSVCILLYSAGDTAVQKYFIDEGNLSEDRKSHEYKKLQIMESYCHTATCLRKYMLEYFGDHSLGDNCGNCSVCNDEMEKKDVTLEAQMILSTIYRSGQRFGKSVLVDVLRGSKNKKVLSFRLDRLKTYGLMAQNSKDSIELLMNKLIAEGYIHKTEEQYPVLKLTEKSIPLLKNQGTVTMQVEKKQKKIKTEEPLLAALRQLRKQIAVREGYPPYVIFHDTALIEMSSMKPMTLEEFSDIKGVGESRRNKYGEEFLQVIRNYVRNREDSTESFEPGVLPDAKEQEKAVLPLAKQKKAAASQQSFDNRYEQSGESVPYESAWDSAYTYAYDSGNNYEDGRNSGSAGGYGEEYYSYYPNMTFDDTDNASREIQGIEEQRMSNNSSDMLNGQNFVNPIDAQENHFIPEYNYTPESNYVPELDKMKEPVYKTYALKYQEGLCLEEIAKVMKVSVQTVENNLFKAYREGMDIDIQTFIQKEYETAISAIIVDDEWDGKLKYIKERVPIDVTYQTIKGVLEKLRRKLYAI